MKYQQTVEYRNGNMTCLAPFPDLLHLSALRHGKRGGRLTLSESLREP